jgi:hypothetical protein
MVTLRRQAAGFTYVWSLLAVAMTSASLALGVQSTSERALREARIEYAWVVEQYRAAIRSYSSSSLVSGGEPLLAIQQLVRDERGGVVRRHLRQLYPNPLTGRLDWRIQTGPNGEPIDIVPASHSSGHGSRVDHLGGVPGRGVERRQ